MPPPGYLPSLRVLLKYTPWVVGDPLGSWREFFKTNSAPILKCWLLVVLAVWANFWCRFLVALCGLAPQIIGAIFSVWNHAFFAQFIIPLFCPILLSPSISRAVKSWKLSPQFTVVLPSFQNFRFRPSITPCSARTCTHICLTRCAQHIACDFRFICIVFSALQVNFLTNFWSTVDVEFSSLYFYSRGRFFCSFFSVLLPLFTIGILRQYACSPESGCLGILIFWTRPSCYSPSFCGLS